VQTFSLGTCGGVSGFGYSIIVRFDDYHVSLYIAGSSYSTLLYSTLEAEAGASPSHWHLFHF
jgi:hypothetical protein